MNRRLSLAKLMGVVLLLGFGLAALSHASAAWVAAVRIATAVSMLAALLGVIYRPDASRAGWAGFALLGWGAFALSFDERPDSAMGLGGLARPLVRSLPPRWVRASGVGDVVEVLRWPEGSFPSRNLLPNPPFTGTIRALGGGRYQLNFGGASGKQHLMWFEANQLKVDDAPELEKIVGSLLVLVIASVGSILGPLLFSARGRSESRPTAGASTPSLE
jgi:hypothetical protein